jgi:hypothetical protein
MTSTSRDLTRSAGLLLAAFLCATLVCADNRPWKSKPYREWSDKDVQSIMTQSPWVQMTTIRRSWLPLSEKDVPPGHQISPQQEIAGGIRQVPNDGSATTSNPSATKVQGEGSEHESNVYVYWDSSRVMRAASARQRVLHGEMKDSEVEPYVRAAQEEYELVLRMDDMTPFIKSDEKFFEANSFLEMKRSTLRLPPSHVVYQRDGSGILRQVVFFFPKKTDSGLTIGSDEIDVEFKCKIADSNLHVGFKPQEMTDQAGPDL